MAIDVRDGLTYATNDDVALQGDLYLPAGKRPCAALVAVHGGGWQIGARSQFQYWGPYLAERGIAVLAISYRLAKKGVKTFPHAVHDVLDAVRVLRSRAGEFGIDPERIGLFGASAGAHLSALAALGGAAPLFAVSASADSAVSAKVKVLIGVYDVKQMWDRYRLASPLDNNIENFLGASPIEEPGSFSGFLAPRLLRFLAERL